MKFLNIHIAELNTSFGMGSQEVDWIRSGMFKSKYRCWNRTIL